MKQNSVKHMFRYSQLRIKLKECRASTFCTSRQVSEIKTNFLYHIHNGQDFLAIKMQSNSLADY